MRVKEKWKRLEYLDIDPLINGQSMISTMMPKQFNEERNGFQKMMLEQLLKDVGIKKYFKTYLTSYRKI